MTPVEAGDLLADLAMLDNRNTDEGMANAWAFALDDVSIDRVIVAVQRIYRRGDDTWIDPKSIRRELAAMQPRFERDVRSAKARGLVPDHWDPRTPLPVDIEQQLHALQAAEWTATNEHHDALATGPGKPIPLGISLRTVPAA